MKHIVTSGCSYSDANMGAWPKYINDYFKYGFNESQIAIAQHIEAMMNDDMLWTMEDGLIDLSLGDSSWI